MEMRPFYTISIFFIVYSPFVFGLNEFDSHVIDIPFGSMVSSHNCDNSNQLISFDSDCYSGLQQTSSWYSFHTPKNKKKIRLNFNSESLGESSTVTIFDNSRYMQIWQNCLSADTKNIESTFVNLETDYTYFIQVSSSFESQGDFNFSVSILNGNPPPNDNCEGAQEMFEDGVLDCYEDEQVFSDLSCATPDPEATGDCVEPTDIGVWYTFSTPDPLPYNTMWQGHGPSNAFEIFSTSSDCSGLEYVTCSENTLMFYPEPGTTYYILLIGSTISWMIQDPPFVISCDSPLGQLNGGPGETTSIATTQCGDPSSIFPCEGDHTVWFEYTTGCNLGDITIEVEEYTSALGDGPAEEIAVIAVFDDCETLLSAYDPNGNGYVCSAMSAGEILTLENVPPNSNLVFGFGSDGNNTGNLMITVNEVNDGASPNDECISGIVLNQGLNIELSNFCSTADFAIPSCGPQSEATVWYEFDAGSSPVDITLDLNPTTILDPAIGVYENCSGDFLASECGTLLELNCITGIVRIQIGSENLNEGEFELEITSELSLIAPLPEFSVSDICSGELTDITIFYPGGEVADFEIYEGSSSSSSIQGLQDQFISGESSITISDLLTNESSDVETAVYFIETSVEGYNCPGQEFEISFMVYPEFESVTPDLEVCPPYVINLSAIDIIQGGVAPYQSFSWLWNGIEDIGSSINLEHEIMEGGIIQLEIVDAAGCNYDTEIEVAVQIIEQPHFDFEIILCPVEDDIIIFPEESEEGIEGTWDPAFIDVDEYSDEELNITFTPTDEYCAETITLEIEIESEEFPEFDLPESLCTNLGVYFFPLEDLNNIDGEWDMESIDLSTLSGEVFNTFYPLENECVHPYEYSFEVVANLDITFDIPSNICLMDTNIVLNPESNEGYIGEWQIPVFNPIMVSGNTFENTWIAEEGGQEFCVSDEDIVIQIIEPTLPQFDLPSFLCNSDSTFYFPLATIDSSIFGTWTIDSISPGIVMDSVQTVFSANSEHCAQQFEWVVSIQQTEDPVFSLENVLCRLDSEITLPTVSDNGISGFWNIPIIDPSSFSEQSIDINFQPDSLYNCINSYVDQVIIENPINGVFNLPEVFCWDDNNFLLPTITDNNIQGSWSIPEVNVQSNIGQVVNAVFTPSDNQCALEYFYETLIVGPYDIQVEENIPADCVSANGNIQLLGNNQDLEFSIDGGLSWQQETIFDDLGSGSYEILIRSMIYTSCVLSLDANLNIVDAPQVEDVIVTNLAGCINDNGEITIEATGNELEYSLDGLSWQSENCFKNLPAGFYQIFVRDTDALDCIVELSASVDDYPETIIMSIAIMDVNDCQVDDGQIEIFADGLSLEYSIDNGVSWSIQSSFNDLPAGQYLVSVRSLDAPDCEDNQLVNIVAPDEPEIIDLNIQNPTSCELEFGYIEVIANGDELEYSINNGQSWQDNSEFQNLSEGFYDVLIREKNFINCIDSETVELVNEIQGLSGISVTSTSVSDCMAQDGVIMVDTSEENVEFSIDGGNTWQEEAVFGGLSSGIYNVIIRKVNNDDCSSTVEATVENEDCPCADLELAYEIFIPDCTSLELASISLLSVEGMMDQNIDFLWNNGETSESILGLISGMYALTISYDNNCIWTENFNIDLPVPLSYDWIVYNTDCPSVDNGAIEIIDVSGGSGNYTFSIDGITFQSENLFDDLSEGVYLVSVQDDNGCIVTQMIQVSSEELIEIEVPELITINQSESVTITPSIQESEIDSFIWSINNTELIGANFILTDFPEESITYSLVIFNGNCIDTVSTFVEVLPNTDMPIDSNKVSIYLGNVFSPSSQSNNFRFFIQSSIDANIQISSFSIYDRWGNLVFDKKNIEINNPDDGWDGTFNNYDVESGVFVYVVLYTLNGNEDLLSGQVTLIR